MSERKYVWDAIREDLKRIDAHNPDFLPNTVLVGAAACWYYRVALDRVGDPDFVVPSYTVEQERLWLSKDLDFMGESNEEISELLGLPCPAMGALMTYAGATIDFVEQGLKMTREAANRTARRVQVGDLNFYIAGPSLLFAEKQACTLQKNRPQDKVHREILARYIKMELCQALEKTIELDTKDWLIEGKEVKTADHDFFADSALARRLHAAAPRLSPEHRAIRHWIGHHVPKPVD